MSDNGRPTHDLIIDLDGKSLEESVHQIVERAKTARALVGDSMMIHIEIHVGKSFGKMAENRLKNLLRLEVAPVVAKIIATPPNG